MKGGARDEVAPHEVQSIILAQAAVYTRLNGYTLPRERCRTKRGELTLRTRWYGCTALTDGIEGDSYLILLERKVSLPWTMLSSAAWPSRLVNTSIHVLSFRKNLVSDSANTWNLAPPGS